MICLVLRDGIESGRYKSGSALPTEDELAREYHVARVTVRRALRELAAADLIERRQGSGTFVRQQPAPGGRRVRSIATTVSQMDAFDHETVARVVEFGYVDTPPEIAAAFGRSGEERMQRAVRVREAGTEVLTHITTWIPERIGRAYDSADMEREPITQLLARSGIRQTSGEQTVSVKMADPDIARLMQLEVGVPMLRVVRIMRDRRRRVVQYVEFLARADRFNVRMKLGS
jgi:GntR family transcriptional regulator